MIYDTKLAEFKKLIGNIEYLKYTINSLIYWDKITNMPKDAIEYRSKTMAFLADQLYQMMADDKFNRYIRYFDGNKENDYMTNAMVYRIKNSSEFIKKIPEKEYEKYIKTIAVSEQVWEESKNNNDFQMFVPYLNEIIDSFKGFTKYWGYREHPYDALMNYYEEGLTVEKMDKRVNDVKSQIIPLIEAVKKSHTEIKEVHIGDIDEKDQMKIWTMILDTMGFNFNSGRIDIGAHPTILANSPNDVRIVNTVQRDGAIAGIFNVLHSGGKGIYQQSISKDLLGTFMAETPSFAVEEAIGRFYENIIGKSKGFWKYMLPKIKEIAPQFSQVTEREIYEYVNRSKPSVIRIESDELTYLIHIIIRYEIEKELIGGKIKIDNLADIWNEKYSSYLGIVPTDHSHGILQEIHWAAGYVGYFPSYFVSNLFAAQLAAAFEKEKGTIDELLARGGFEELNQWLTEKVFKFGAMYNTLDLIKNSTGESLNSEYYVDYLQKKFSAVYKLNEG